MAEKRLGSYLRARREARGVSLEALAQETRIASRILEALEQDRLRSLPAPVFVRGFIRAYLQCLGEPPGEALALYDAWLAAHAPREAPPPPRRRPRASLVAAGLLVLLLAAGLYVVASHWNGQGSRPAERASVQVSDLVSIPAPSPDSPEPAAPGAADGQRAASAPDQPEGHRLIVRAHEQAWVLVETDPGVATTALLAPGESREWWSRSRFVLTVGNAGGVSLELDGRTLPALGGSGEVVRGIVLPPESGS